MQHSSIAMTAGIHARNVDYITKIYASLPDF